MYPTINVWCAHKIHKQLSPCIKLHPCGGEQVGERGKNEKVLFYKMYTCKQNETPPSPLPLPPTPPLILYHSILYCLLKLFLSPINRTRHFRIYVHIIAYRRVQHIHYGHILCTTHHAHQPHTVRPAAMSGSQKPECKIRANDGARCARRYRQRWMCVCVPVS